MILTQGSVKKQFPRFWNHLLLDQYQMHIELKIRDYKFNDDVSESEYVDSSALSSDSSAVKKTSDDDENEEAENESE